MKKMKKLLSMLLTVIMVLAMAAPSFADETQPIPTGNNGSVTVNKAIDGLTYNAYRILDAVMNDDKTSIAYTLSTKWNGFLSYEKDGEKVSDYLEVISNTQNIRWKSSATDAEGLSKLALAYVEDNSITKDYSTVAANGVASFGEMVDGYYLIDAGAGSLCELNTNKPGVVITEKNGAPEVEKKIIENDNKISSNTASVGDYISYEVTITAKPGAANYVLNDSMSEGLTFVKSFTDGTETKSLTVKKGNVPLTENTDYTIVNKSNDQGFTLTFTDSFMASLRTELANLTTESKEINIVVTYYARLNEKAVVAGDGNTNEATLNYGDNHTTTPTDDSKTTTKTYQINVQKYTAQFDNQNQEVPNTQVALAGAKFTLSKNKNGTNPIKVTSRTAAEGETLTVPTYKVNVDQSVDGVTEIETSITGTANGTFAIEGLAAGTYYLTEIEAPTGYNKLSTPVTITIGNDGTVTGADNGLTKVLNRAGALLPSTGGIGTTIFYAAGIILMAGAVFFVVRRKKA